MHRFALLLIFALTFTLVACGDDNGGTSTGAGSKSELLPAGYDHVYAARFSPDGTRLAMLAEKGDTTHLITTDLSGGDVQVVLESGLSYLSTVSWFSSADALMFSGDGGILKVGLDGSAPTLLVDAFAVSGFDLAPDDSEVVWSVNGMSILKRAPLGATVVDAADIVSGPDGQEPRYSPDGTRIVFMAAGAFYIIDAAFAGEPTALPGAADYLSNAAWLDDSTLLMLVDETIVRFDLGAMSGKTLVDAFAATHIDASPVGYVYNVNGMLPLMLVRF